MLCGSHDLNLPKHIANETLSKLLYPILNRAFVSPKTERVFLMIVGVYCTNQLQTDCREAAKRREIKMNS